MREEVVPAGAGTGAVAVAGSDIVKPAVVASSKSMVPSCSALKLAYSNCFNRWYTDKFVTNRWDKVECFLEMEAYRACITQNSSRNRFQAQDGR